MVLADGAEDPRFEPGAMPEKEFFGSLQIGDQDVLVTIALTLASRLLNSVDS